MLSDRAPLTAFERRLRPAPSSNRPLVLAVLVVGLLAALALLLSQGWFRADDSARRGPPDPAAGRVSPAAPSVPLPPSSAVPASSPQPRIERITKCVNSAGAASYSDGPCPAGLRSATVELRPDSNLADGMSPQAREASSQQNREAAQARAAHERRVAMQVDGAVSACASLEAEIAWLDAAARQPQSAGTQDDLRARRKQARDRQFALRCR